MGGEYSLWTVGGGEHIFALDSNEIKALHGLNITTENHWSIYYIIQYNMYIEIEILYAEQLFSLGREFFCEYWNNR